MSLRVNSGFESFVNLELVTQSGDGGDLGGGDEYYLRGFAAQALSSTTTQAVTSRARAHNATLDIVSMVPSISSA